MAVLVGRVRIFGWQFSDIWVSIGVPLEPFGYPLDPFRDPFGSLWDNFGGPWPPLGAMLVTLVSF